MRKRDIVLSFNHFGVDVNIINGNFVNPFTGWRYKFKAVGASVPHKGLWLGCGLSEKEAKRGAIKFMKSQASIYGAWKNHQLV